MSTTTATILGAVIALSGVLLTVVATTTSSLLQRRHERRLRLDEVRREVYVRYLTKLWTYGEAQEDVATARAEVPARKPDGEETLEEVQKRAEATQEMAIAIEHGLELLRELIALATEVQLIAGPEVQRAATKAYVKTRAPEGVDLKSREELVNACRSELGVSGPIVHLTVR